MLRKLFRKCVKGFLGNTKNENCKTLIEELLKLYKSLGCRMSLKNIFLHSHLDFFPENLNISEY